MATILLSAAGAAVGAGFGGTVLGLSGAVIGRAIGATIGRAIDQKLLGAGSGSVETGRVDRLRLSSAGEGAPIGRLWGRMRIPGQVIWTTRFFETATRQKGGKGASRPTVTNYSYSVSLALALCEGKITRVGRVWADGIEIARGDLNMRVYDGSEDQLPDPKIAAVEGADRAPAYRGIAYVVLEDLALERFGNRVPQFTFEVVRPAQGAGIGDVPDLIRGTRAVAMIPGTGEYSLATTPVLYNFGLGAQNVANENSPSGMTDFSTSLSILDEELPNCEAVSLVVSWFGDDLRCGSCEIRPKVEGKSVDGTPMPWVVSGLVRADAQEVVRREGKAVYGGTPADGAVLEAIAALKQAGKSVTFYPFILMEQLTSNTLPDPWTGAASQPALPWRGRITLSAAPGQPGSLDGTAAAATQVAAFFGGARPEHFIRYGQTLGYHGPAEWSLRRFVLHYAHLCAMAGGVDAFCISSEMRALTQIRGANDSFPAVAQLVQLAADVRAILGPECKIGYAADWSEYFGYQPGNGDRFFHLDPLWASPDVDFVGIDNYMPLSDWRDGDDHADAGWGSIYNLDYLRANIAGGEGFDWYYENQTHRDLQIRTPITDGAHDEPWIWRYKDIRAWWENPHHERIGGGRQNLPTAWEPRSKPIWFTEIGCAAVDKGTNQPNKFLDPKSSESSLPWYSDGRRDELIQQQYLRAMSDYWSQPENNPLSDSYGGRMVDAGRSHVWAWDARPYPQFPANGTLWTDAGNYPRGHWISGRVTAQPLASVVAEICASSGLVNFDVSDLYGLVRGYMPPPGVTARGALQALMLAYGFEAVERDGQLRFQMRLGRVDAVLQPDLLAVGDAPTLETLRAPEAETAGRVRLSYVEADGDYETRAVEAIFPDEVDGPAAASELNLAMTRSESQGIVERWLSEARVARDGARFTLPPSLGHIGAGDVVEIAGDRGALRYRLDRVESAGVSAVEAVRIEPGVYLRSDEAEERALPKPFVPPIPVLPVFMDLPLLSGEEVPHAPHLAVTATPWPGNVAVYTSGEDSGYAFSRLIERRAIVGETLSPLEAAKPGLWDRGAPLRLRLKGGELQSVSVARLLDGANAMAIGDGSATNWEVMQFANAELVAPDTWELSLRLRGQAGTDAIMPPVWPVGSRVVILDGAPQQIELSLQAREVTRHYRIGPALRGYDDPSYTHVAQAFSGIGLRPLSPCHLRWVRNAAGLDLSWIRRTRIGGDNWSALDVPLGEGSEGYLLRVRQGGATRREVLLASPFWLYSDAARAADGISGPFAIEVAQISETFGPGPFTRIEINE